MCQVPGDAPQRIAWEQARLAVRTSVVLAQHTMMLTAQVTEDSLGHHMDW